MNLHAIARGPVSAVNAEEQVYLVQSLGSVNLKGRTLAQYAAAEPVTAQVQTLNADTLQALNDALRTAHLRRFYLFSDTVAGHKPEGQWRVRSRPGDFIYRPRDRTWWKVFELIEDFEISGWVCVGASLQVKVPAEVEEQVPGVLCD